MKYIAIDINGWLNGTVCRFLTKAEKSVWSDLIMLGGYGSGRFGYVEAAKGIAYTRSEILSLTHCFSEEDIAAFDSCIKKCVEGVTIEGVTDKARIEVDDKGIIHILNWHVYQHSDFPEGYTEAEAKELKRQREAEKKAKLEENPKKDKTPTEKSIAAASYADSLIRQAEAIAPEATDKILSEKFVKRARGKNVDPETGEIKDGE